MRNVTIRMAERFSNGIRTIRVRALVTDGDKSTYAEWTNTNCWHDTETVVEVTDDKITNYVTRKRERPVEQWVGISHPSGPMRRYVTEKFEDEHGVFDHILKWSKRCSLHPDRYYTRKSQTWLNDLSL